MNFTINELAKRYLLTRQAIYLKIKEKRLPACKKNGKWFISEKDFIEYEKSKYKRRSESNKSHPLWIDGNYSVPEAAEIIGCTEQNLYYALRINKIKGTRYRCAWIIHIDDINLFKKTYKPRTRRNGLRPSY